MADSQSSFHPTRAHYRVLGVVGLLLTVFLLLPTGARDSISHVYKNTQHTAGTPNKAKAPESHLHEHDDQPQNLGKLVQDQPLTTQPSSENCGSRFGSEYIQAFSRTATQYCDAESWANLTCFSHKVDEKRVDSFCYGGPALFDFAHRGEIHIDCKVRDLTDSELQQGIPQFRNFPTYWYDTGPSYIFKEKMNVDRMEDHIPEYPEVSLLIQREDNNRNLWHTMMEIMSLTFSLDVLRQTTDPLTGKPFWTEAELAKTRAVFTDRLEHGPYWDLWRLFAEKPSIRMTEMSSRLNIAITKILVPLPGGSNPFWQGDWTPLSCGESSLLKQYVQRVLKFFNVQEGLPRGTRPLILTVVNRTKKRRLLHQDEYIEALKKKHPSVDIQVINFAKMPLAEQIRTAHQSDILVGVHGAGLTHGMWLPESSALVEILPPDLDHWGFSNMAKFLGHRHYRTKGSKHDSPDNNGDWQHDDVFIGKDDFLAHCEKAIASFSRTSRSSNGPSDGTGR
jgi:protein O-GlcNAc transferase